MPLIHNKRIGFFHAVSLLITGSFIAGISVYLMFDFYVSSVSRELVSSWLQTEAVNIQEGNLLSSITKHQRVLLSSNLVKGVVLFDTSTVPYQRLIEVGDKLMPTEDLTRNFSEVVEVLPNGFLAKQTIFKIPHRPELVLVFGTKSPLVEKVFLSAVLMIVVFIFSLIFSVKYVQRREFLKREQFLKQALNDFIDSEKPSSLLNDEFPLLLDWWRSKKTENELALQIAFENKEKILLGEIAARLAHDIRAPLAALDAALESIELGAKGPQTLLRDAIQRVKSIASGITYKNLNSKTDMVPSLFNQGVEDLFLLPIIESLVDEKRIMFRDRNIKFSPLTDSFKCISKVNDSDLKRTLSNLIDNAVEACDKESTIEIKLFSKNNLNLIEITDNGRGISHIHLKSIGEKNYSIGKPNGSGLGVYYSKKCVESWNGRFQISSTEGVGTTVAISLPMSPAHTNFQLFLDLTPKQRILIVDDDPSIHFLWKTRFDQLSSQFDFQLFYDAQSAFSWLESTNNQEPCIMLCDYDLKSESFHGIDVINRVKKFAIVPYLVTTIYNSKPVQSECTASECKIIPKQLIPYLPIFLKSA